MSGFPWKALAIAYLENISAEYLLMFYVFQEKTVLLLNEMHFYAYVLKHLLPYQAPITIMIIMYYKFLSLCSSKAKSIQGCKIKHRLDNSSNSVIEG